ncbi:hypothetical protein BDU57DRAFT_519656 [Ampelomyces quisqualis]|uniref:F-box domain-containing protein n=1 Tax=Ampelomyces quisqualis TaxID=50730 RepID=A0A6A5QJC0_AMPQU|nr:hypothetical protein BDU57DRAFT_519656 [Ampelomyces quisqualis]
MASLLTLPLELLVRVSSFLTTPELGALRLTCQQVEKSLYEWFSQEFFTKKQFMLTHKSLQAFVDISRHTSFSQKLSHVIIATNIYRSEIAASTYRQGYVDQQALMDTGVDREMLTEAFKNLKNLRTVGIRDFNNHERARDGITWTSWGAPTVEKETGRPLDFVSTLDCPHHATSRFMEHLFQTLIYALGKANQTPEELEVLLRRQALSDCAFHVPNFNLRAVEPVLLGLKKLFLRVDAVPARIGNNPAVRSNVSAPIFRRFLKRTPNVEHLRLNLARSNDVQNRSFMQWLALPPRASDPLADDHFDPPPVDLAFLSILDLGQCVIEVEIVLDILVKYAPTLQGLNLWKLSLWPSSGTTAVLDEPNLWSKFFRMMAKIPQLQLNQVKVGMLSQGPTHVQFKSPDRDDAPLLKVKQYSGTEMGAFLKELEVEATVMWPKPIAPRDEESDEDEEMTDDDEDESASDEDGENEGDDDDNDDED